MAHGEARNRDSNSNLDAPLGEQSTSAEALQSPLGDPLVTIGFLAIVLPLFFHLTAAQTLTAGAETSRTLDYVAICGGVIADACGTLLVVKRVRSKAAGSSQSKAPVRLAVAILLSGLGVLHLLRGLGFIKLGLLG